MDTNTLLESISKKLGILIALSLIGMNNKATTTDNIELLGRFGLTAKEISEILNTSRATVDTIKTRLRKKIK